MAPVSTGERCRENTISWTCSLFVFSLKCCRSQRMVFCILYKNGQPKVESGLEKHSGPYSSKLHRTECRFVQKDIIEFESDSWNKKKKVILVQFIISFSCREESSCSLIYRYKWQGPFYPHIILICLKHSLIIQVCIIPAFIQAFSQISSYTRSKENS